MEPIDEIMMKCPLKHEIRVSFWEPLIRKLKKNTISYLTLYSPPLMDVKYLYSEGLIKEKEGVFSNVVGVGTDVEAEAESNSEVNYRLELLLHGNINELLDESSMTEKKKQLRDKFPFDVINLDYCDTLHKSSLGLDISPHINAIETILERQKKSDKEEFILFLTTCVNLEHYGKNLLTHLKEKFEENISNTPDFLKTLQEICNSKSSDEYMRINPNNYFALALCKSLLLQIKDYHFDITSVGIKWLVRDQYPKHNDKSSSIEKYLLHLAFHIKQYRAPKATKLKMIGKRHNPEHYSLKLIKREYETLRESIDKNTLTEKHKENIENIYKLNFEIQLPSIKSSVG